MKALDISNFSGTFSSKQAQELRDSARRLVVGTQDDAIAINQVTLGEGACMEIQLYAQLYFAVPHSKNIDKSVIVRDATKLDGGVRLWLACEDVVPEGMSPDVVDCWIWKAVQDASGKGFRNIGIYTRKNWWEEAMGNSTHYSSTGFPLWVAQYDDVGDLTVYDAFGGWDRPEMKQFAVKLNDGPIIIGGVQVDRNVY